jgi:hypothetical protein
MRGILTSVIAVAVFGASLMTGSSIQSAAQADASVDYAFVQAEPNGDLQTSDYHTFNSSGGANMVTHDGAGIYTVILPGLGLPNEGSVQVSAFADNGRAICNTGFWAPSGADQAVQVLCFDSNGAPADSAFTLTYINARATTSDPAAGFGAYLWAGDATAAAAYDVTNYSYNSTGATNSVERTGTGTYTATLPGFTGENGVPQVTGYIGQGGTSPVVCSPFSWMKADEATLTVDVTCFDATGAPADAMFTLSYSMGTNPVGTPNDIAGSYAFVPVFEGDGAGLALDNQSNAGGNITVMRRTGGSEVGDYQVIIPGRGQQGVPQVSVVDNTGATCSVLGYGPQDANGFVDVVCFDANGTHVDAAFTVSI